MAIDPTLEEFATPLQWEYCLAVEKYGSANAAGEALGKDPSGITRAIRNVKAKAAANGVAPEADLEHRVPEGMKLKKVSDMRRNSLGLPQWISYDPDKEAQAEALEAMYAAFCRDLPVIDPIAPAGTHHGDLMACYIVGDHHFGMFADPSDGGGEYDLDKASALLFGAMDHLVTRAPKCGQALIVLLGDFCHYDNMTGTTSRNGHSLDVDGRPHQMIDAAIDGIRFMIEAALKHHDKVHLIVEIGNHDDMGMLWAPRAFNSIYRNEPRVTVDTSALPFHYFRFGKNLIGTHHGHTVKPGQLPLLMATDRAADWGATEHRFWWTGHVHHKDRDKAKDHTGCEVESFRILAPADAYAQGHGYRSKSGMTCIVLDAEHGEDARYTVSPSMLQRKGQQE